MNQFISHHISDKWQSKKLEECVDILDSKRIPIKKEDRDKKRGDIPYYGATGLIDYVNDFIFNEELLLLGEDGAPFKDKTKPISYIISGKSWVNNHAHVIRAKPNITTNRFLKYYLDSFDFSDSISGSTRDKLTQGVMRNIPIPTPPLEEQNAIVAKIEKLLSRVEAAKERLNRVPAIIQQFRQSTLNQIWKQNSPSCLIELKEVLKFGPQNGLYKPGSEYGTGVPIIRIDSFYDGKISHLSGLKRLNCSPSELDTYGLNVGDILINRVNSLVFLGKCGLITALHEPTVFESNMMRCTPDITKIDGRFLTFLLCSSLIKEQILKKAKNAVNQSSINQKDVNSLQIICPPIKEQQIIVRKIDTLFTHAERIEAQVADARERVETISQSILYQAFTGRLIQNEEIVSLI